METETRKAPESIKDNFKSFVDLLLVLKWVREKIVTHESLVWIKKMFGLLILIIAIQAIMPWVIGFSLNGLGPFH